MRRQPLAWVLPLVRGPPVPASISPQVSLQVADGLGKHVFLVARGLARPAQYAQLGLQAEAAVGTMLSHGCRGWRFRLDMGRCTLGEAAGQSRTGCR